jgi:Fe-S cluster biosynthesis and repair protein YggX/predicted TPR repeat methyltransferase
MDLNDRIAQFENMVREGADPTNDMAWFSLAGAYAQASRHADAARAYRKCIELNPNFSKAYQLAGESLRAAGDTNAAVAILTEGHHVAAKKGDLMPKRAIAELLKSLGAPVPENVTPVAVSAPSDFIDRKTGRPGTRMSRPPFKGPIGQWIAQHISQETFEAWIRQGTKVINELRLDLSREQDEATYDAHMREYLGLDDEMYEQITGRKPEKSAGSLGH